MTPRTKMSKLLDRKGLICHKTKRFIPYTYVKKYRIKDSKYSFIKLMKLINKEVDIFNKKGNNYECSRSKKTINRSTKRLKKNSSRST